MFKRFDVFVRVWNELPLWLHPYPGIWFRLSLLREGVRDNVLHLLCVVEFIRGMHLSYASILTVAWTLLRHRFATAVNDGLGCFEFSFWRSAAVRVFEATAVLDDEVCWNGHDGLLKVANWIVGCVLADWVNCYWVIMWRLYQIWKLKPVFTTLFMRLRLALAYHVVRCLVLIYLNVGLSFYQHWGLTMSSASSLCVDLLHLLLIKQTLWIDHHSCHLSFGLGVLRCNFLQHTLNFFVDRWSCAVAYLPLRLSSIILANTLLDVAPHSINLDLSGAQNLLLRVICWEDLTDSAVVIVLMGQMPLASFWVLWSSLHMQWILSNELGCRLNRLVSRLILIYLGRINLLATFSDRYLLLVPGDAPSNIHSACLRHVCSIWGQLTTVGIVWKRVPAYSSPPIDPRWVWNHLWVALLHRLWHESLTDIKLCRSQWIICNLGLSWLKWIYNSS